MKKNIILTVLFSVTASLQAQPDTLWTRYYVSDEVDEIQYMEELPDGGLIMTGSTLDLITHDYDILLLRTDINGDTLWTRKFGGIGREYPEEVHRTTDGGFIIIGRSSSFGMGGFDFYLVKTDSSGNLIWQKTYGGIYEDGGGSVRETQDGGYIMAGTTHSLLFGTYTMWVVRTDSVGDTLWTKTFDREFGNAGKSLHLLQGGDIIITGVTQVESNHSDHQDFWLVRLDEDGNLLWEQRYGGSLRESPSDMQVTSDGGYIISGYTESFGNGKRDAWLVRTDSLGNLLWSRAYGGTENEIAYSVKETHDGGFVFASFTRPSADAGGIYAWAVRTDSQGDTLWTMKLAENWSMGKAVVHSKEGPYLFSGTISIDNKAPDAFLVKVVVRPYILIRMDSAFVDLDGDGYAEGILNGAGSYSAEGYEVISYEWSLNGEIIGTDSVISYTLPTGTHTITLTVTDEKGISNSKEVEIDVYHNRLPLNSPASSAVTSIGDTIFFTFTEENVIYKYDSDSKILWSTPVGSSVQSALTVGRDNTIYAATQDSGLYALSIDGEILFQVPMERIGDVSPAVGPDGTVYIGTLSRNFYAFDGSDGSVKWVIDMGVSAVSSPAISRSGTIYVNGGSKSLYALNPDGSVAWTFKTGGVLQYTPALDSDGNVYFSSNDGSLYAVSPSGGLIWSMPLGGIVRGSPVIAADGTIYVKSIDASVYALSSTGEILWSYKTDKPLSGTPVLLTGGRVCFGTLDGELFVLDSNGEVEIFFKTVGAMTAPPLVTSDGIIHIGSDDGNVYMLADPYFNSDLPSGQWHTFQGNNQRTGYQGTLVSVKDNKTETLPTKYSLKQNYPNPFNPVTLIEYDLPLKSHVLLTVYNLNGQEIARLTDEVKPAGRYQTEFDASGFSSGIYIYRIQAKNYSKARKMLLLK